MLIRKSAITANEAWTRKVALREAKERGYEHVGAVIAIADPGWRRIVDLVEAITSSG